MSALGTLKRIDYLPWTQKESCNNGDADIENRLVGTVGEGEGGTNSKSNTETRGGASSRGARRRHTPRGKAQARPWTLPGSAAHSRQAALGARPVLSRACRGIGQHPTGHGWAPPDIEAHAYVSHLCTWDTAGNQRQGPGPRTLGLVGGSTGEVQSPLRRKHCASHTDPGCRMSPGVPPASWEGKPSPPNSPRIGIRPTGNSTCQLTGQEAVSRFWTSALPCASFTNYSVMHSNTRPSARSWGPTNE